MNIRRRLEALEKRLISEPTLLFMPDGSTASIPGRGEYLLKLFVVAARGANVSPEQAKQLELIQRSTGAIKAGGGCLVEVIRCCLLGPVKKAA